MGHRGYPRKLPCEVCAGTGSIVRSNGETVTWNYYYRDDSVVGGWVVQEMEQEVVVEFVCNDCHGKG
jgi:hypothetical protein